MDDLNDKVTGGTLEADEWNQVPSELQNIIEQSGQSLTGADLDQLGKGVARYGVSGGFCVEDGTSAANAYVLNTGWGQQQPPNLRDGIRIIAFINPGRVNTGPSTLQYGSFAPAQIRRVYNATVYQVNPGDIQGYVEFEYNNPYWNVLGKVEQKWIESVIADAELTLDPTDNDQLATAIKNIDRKRYLTADQNYVWDEQSGSAVTPVNGFQFDVVAGTRYEIELMLYLGYGFGPADPLPNPEFPSPELFMRTNMGALNDPTLFSLIGQITQNTGFDPDQPQTFSIGSMDDLSYRETIGGFVIDCRYLQFNNGDEKRLLKFNGVLTPAVSETLQFKIRFWDNGGVPGANTYSDFVIMHAGSFMRMTEVE